MRLIDADALIEKFNDAGVNITFDIPVEELLGEDVDLDDFSTLVQDAVMAYRNMAIDTIKNQPTAYDIENIVEQLEEEREFSYADFERYVEEVSPCLDSEYDDFFHRGLERAIKIVKEGGANEIN